MVYEISQFDIRDRQLLAAEVKPKAAAGVDIGEARVTRTIFGRPRIRVICERDKKRRAWMLRLLAVVLVVAAASQGWVELQKMLSTPPPLPLSARMRVSPPVYDSEDFTPSNKRQKTQMQILLEGMATHRPPEPPEPLKSQQSQVKASGKIAAKPGKAPGTSQPRTLATNDSAPKVQTDVPQPASLADPDQPADSIQPADRASLEKAVINAGVSAQLPAADDQKPASDSAKP